MSSCSRAYCSQRRRPTASRSSLRQPNCPACLLTGRDSCCSGEIGQIAWSGFPSKPLTNNPERRMRAGRSPKQKKAP